MPRWKSRCGRGQPRLQLASGTLLEWGNAEINAQMTADFRTTDGESFALEGDVSREWIVDTVECSPSDAMDDWSLEEWGVRAKLKITLAQAISPSRPVRIRIAARRLYSHPGPSHLGQKLGIEDLLPLHFVTRGGSDQLVAIDVPGNYDLSITSLELLHRLDPRSLDSRQLELFPTPPRQVVFRANAAGVGARMSLEQRRPAFSATIRAEATLARDMFQESYWLRCQPESTPVERVLVHFSRERSVPLRWEMKNEPAGELSARALTAVERLIAGVSPQEEAWEILLRRARSEPFEIHALRSVKFKNPEQVSLASLPEAASQSGTLVIRSWESDPTDLHGCRSGSLKITNARLTPIDVDPAPAGTWAAFRYNPGRDAVASREGPVTVSRTDEVVTQPLWVWSCHLRSRYQTDGSAEHLAVYRLQNSHRQPVAADIAGGGDHRQRAQRLGRRKAHGLATGCQEGHRNELAIDLPSGEKFPTVAVSFTTAEGRMGSLGSRSLPCRSAAICPRWPNRGRFGSRRATNRWIRPQARPPRRSFPV